MFGPVLGSVGDLRRATLWGEGETEPKQIGEGTQDSTERLKLRQGNRATVCVEPLGGAHLILDHVEEFKLVQCLV